MNSSFDVVVVGAGVAGAACAKFLAEGGRRVALVDRRPFSHAGARWVNGVPADAFDDARIARPRSPELRSEGHAFIVASPSGRTRVRLQPSPVLEVDMRHLGDRMREGARAAGAKIYEETAVSDVALEGGGPVSIVAGGDVLDAKLFVDASGLPAVVRRHVFPHWPDIPREHLCLAAQSVHEITDVDAARRYLADHELGEGEVYAQTGTHGGYSVFNIRVDPHEREVSLLTGAVPDSGSTGAQMIDEFVRSHPWVGARIFGGAGALPLRRPYSRLVSRGLALLGDAGSQMFPAHGSGIAIGLRAARLLADVVLDVDASQAGDEEVLFRYASRFHRAHAGSLCGYDAVRRMAQRFSVEDSELFYSSGLAAEATVHAALAQRLPSANAHEMLATARAAARAPWLAARAAAVLAKMPLFVANARTYPSRLDLKGIESYEARTARLMGEGADPVS